MACDYDSSRLHMSISKQCINSYLQNNTLSSYTNNFEQPLVLNEEYDVGLAEIQFPQSWNDIREGSNTTEIGYSYPKLRRERHMVKKYHQATMKTSLI